MATTQTDTNNFTNPTTGQIDYNALQQAIINSANRTRNVVGSPTIDPYLALQQSSSGLGLGTSPATLTDLLKQQATPNDAANSQKYQDYQNWWSGGGAQFWTDAPSPFSKAQEEGWFNAPQPTSQNLRAQNALNQVQGLATDYQTQYQTTQQQAEQAASAFEAKGAGAMSSLQNLGKIQDQIGGSVNSASAKWADAIQEAKDYAHKDLVGPLLAHLDDAFDKINKDMDFSKAHDLQASVQAVTGEMNNSLRQIAQLYGVGSKEYASAIAGKQNTLATIQSNINASYAKLGVDQNLSYLNATATLAGAGTQYENYNAKNYIDTLVLAAQNDQSYSLQAAQLDATLEQMKGTVMGDFTEAWSNLPTFSMEVSPALSAISSIMNTMVTQGVIGNG